MGIQKDMKGNTSRKVLRRGKRRSLSMNTNPVGLPRVPTDDNSIYSISPLLESNSLGKYDSNGKIGNDWLFGFLNVIFPNKVSAVIADYISDKETDLFTKTFDDFLDNFDILPVKFCVLMYIRSSVNNKHIKGGHANAVVVDVSRKQIHHFEPNGSVVLTSAGLWPLASLAGEYIHDKIQEKTKESFDYHTIDKCPVIGVQAQEHFATEMIDAFTFSARNIGGYCLAWSCMFIHYHLLNPSLSNDEIYSLLVLRFDSAELSQRIYKYAGVMKHFQDTNDLPDMHFKRLISKNDFIDVTHICQEFVKNKLTNVKNINYFTGDLKLEDEDLIDEFYSICGVREVIRKFLAQRKMDYVILHRSLKNGLEFYSKLLIEFLRIVRQAN